MCPGYCTDRREGSGEGAVASGHQQVPPQGIAI